jgi:hypothetical protein
MLYFSKIPYPLSGLLLAVTAQILRGFFGSVTGQASQRRFEIGWSHASELGDQDLTLPPFFNPVRKAIMMIYVIPVLIIACILSSYFSDQISKTNTGYLYYLPTAILNIILWLIVARTSKNLLIDSIIFDVVMTIAFAAGFVFLSYANGFSITNWIGVVLCILGIILIKV